jgi:hypothetical protein
VQWLEECCATSLCLRGRVVHRFYQVFVINSFRTLRRESDACTVVLRVFLLRTYGSVVLVPLKRPSLSLLLFEKSSYPLKRISLH